MSGRLPLWRFETVVYKNKGPSDAAQVPAGATIDFYPQGATSTTSPNLTCPAFSTDNTLDVQSIGSIRTGDTVKVGPSGPSLLVTDTPTQTQLILENDSSSAVVIHPGDRLIPTTTRPTVYSDPWGDTELSGSQVSSSSDTGRASCFIGEERFDYQVTVASDDKRYFADAAAPVVRHERAWRDARDFLTIQDAIDSLPSSGGIVYLPGGDPYELSAGLVISTSGVTLMGDGIYSTILKPAEGLVNTFDMITLNASYVTLSNLQIDCLSTTQNLASGKCGIVVNGPGITNRINQGCRLENIDVLHASRYGLWVDDAIVFLAVNSTFVFNRGHGARIETPSSPPYTAGSCTAIRFLSCQFSQNGDTIEDGAKGVEARAVSGLTFIGCSFEGNRGGYGSTEGNGVDADGCYHVELLSCAFEDAATATTTHSTRRAAQFAYLHECHGSVVESCTFQGGAEHTSIPFHLQPSRAVLFSNTALARCSNISGTSMFDEIIRFDEDCFDCIELGNRDLNNNNGYSRMTLGKRVFGLSRHAVGLYRYGDETTRPDPTISYSGAIAQGSLIWVDSPGTGHSHLQVWDGSSWKNVALT